MRHVYIALLSVAPLAASATPPPPDVPFQEKACQSAAIVVGQASDLRITRRPKCPYRGDGKHLTVCEEIQVTVTVTEIIRAKNSAFPRKFVFGFGGGMFSVGDLRTDLLSGPRYFFLGDPSSKPIVYRTSYPWFLGAPATPENATAVQEALQTCPAPNNSFKPKPLRGSA